MSRPDPAVSPLPLVLASSSPYRREQLVRLGVRFRWRAPLLDEEAMKATLGGLSPAEQARQLATAKALSLRVEEPESTLIGSDQLVALDGRILGKPGSPEGAVAQLLELAGRSHELVTALAVHHGDEVVTHVDVATLTMRALDRAEVERYVAVDRPVDCAGSYKLERQGIALFERIVAEDHSAITGLPLIALVSILRRRGYAVP
jgi:septum formation protein